MLGEFLRHAAAVVDDLQAQRERMRRVADAHAVFGARAQRDVGRAGFDRVAHQVPHRLREAVGVADADRAGSGRSRARGAPPSRRRFRPGAARVRARRGCSAARCGRGGAGDSRRSSRPVRRSTSDSISADQFARVVVVRARWRRRASNCAAPFEPGQRIAQLVRQALQRGRQRHSATRCAGSSPGNSSTGCASSNQPPAIARATSHDRRSAGARRPGTPSEIRRSRAPSALPSRNGANEGHRPRAPAPPAAAPPGAAGADPEPPRASRVGARDPPIGIGPGTGVVKQVEVGRRGHPLHQCSASLGGRLGLCQSVLWTERHEVSFAFVRWSGDQTLVGSRHSLPPRRSDRFRPKAEPYSALKSSIGFLGLCEGGLRFHVLCSALETIAASEVVGRPISARNAWPSSNRAPLARRRRSRRDACEWLWKSCLHQGGLEIGFGQILIGDRFARLTGDFRRELREGVGLISS